VAYSIIIGIDQTGAVNPSGALKPLKLAVFDLRKKKDPKLISNLIIPSLNKDSILKLFEGQLNAPIKNQDKVFILVDSVFGLPEALDTTFEEMLKSMKNFKSSSGKLYGAHVAHEFFNSFLKINEEVPKRNVEKIVSANSIFNLHPFQRNISCGTYRVLKDILEERLNFGIWPFENWQDFQFVLSEGFPTFYWKLLFQSKTRNVEVLHEFLKIHYPLVVLPKDPDFADALVLALAGRKLLDENFHLMLLPNFSKISEGWIFGVAET
jgi:hypothetical protein